MSKKQISIIIPTYNMEQYIAKCLDSLLIPEIDQVEVWVVNDGSKDRTSEIAHSYADRYPQSINVIDKPNGNYGSCINAALPRVTGRYVKVLDADDTFDTAAFSDFVRMLPDLSDDVLITPFVTVDKSGKILHEIIPHQNNDDNKSVYSISDIILRKRTFVMHSITYNINIFSQFNYHQTEGISFTDTEWACIPFSYAKSIRFVKNLLLYRYLKGREGQTMDPSRLESQHNHFLLIARNLIDEYELSHNSDNPREYVGILLISYIRYIFTTILIRNYSNSLPKIAELDRRIKKYPDIYNAINECSSFLPLKYKPLGSFRACNYDINFSIPQKYLIFVKIKDELRKIRNFLKGNK